MRYLRSKWSDKAYLILDKENKIASMFELLGIYRMFCKKNTKSDSFSEFYSDNVNKRPFHFRNIGEKFVRDALVTSEKESGKTRKHSRCNFRLLSKTWNGIPVITSEDMGAIFFELSKILIEKTETERILTQLLRDERSAEKVFGFQYEFLTDYVLPNARIASSKKRSIFNGVLNEWIENPLFTQP